MEVHQRCCLANFFQSQLCVIHYSWKCCSGWNTASRKLLWIFWTWCTKCLCSPLHVTVNLHKFWLLSWILPLQFLAQCLAHSVLSVIKGQSFDPCRQHLLRYPATRLSVFLCLELGIITVGVGLLIGIAAFNVLVAVHDDNIQSVNSQSSKAEKLKYKKKSQDHLTKCDDW